MNDVVERVARAMQNVVIRDDEGEFPRLFDMLDFSGENKAVTVVRALARAAIEAMREPTDEMLDQGVAKLESAPFVPPYEVWQIMIDAALADASPDIGKEGIGNDVR